MKHLILDIPASHDNPGHRIEVACDTSSIVIDGRIHLRKKGQSHIDFATEVQNDCDFWLPNDAETGEEGELLYQLLSLAYYRYTDGNTEEYRSDSINE